MTSPDVLAVIRLSYSNAAIKNNLLWLNAISILKLFIVLPKKSLLPEIEVVPKSLSNDRYLLSLTKFKFKSESDRYIIDSPLLRMK